MHHGSEVKRCVEREINVRENREVRGGVIISIGEIDVCLSGLEFFGLLKEMKSYGQDWGRGARPTRDEIDATLKSLRGAQ